MNRCENCDGTGHESGPSAGMSWGRPCPACEGTGKTDAPPPAWQSYEPAVLRAVKAAYRLGAKDMRRVAARRAEVDVLAGCRAEVVRNNIESECVGALPEPDWTAMVRAALDDA